MTTLIRNQRLAISEIFSSFQGEGPSVGQPRTFVRLGGCNLKCSWCDTKYTWDWQGEFGQKYNPREEIRIVPYDRVYSEIMEYQDRGVVVTGGEPLLQWRSLEPLLIMLQEENIYVEVETNGTVIPGFSAELVDQFNVSPKLANSGMDYDRRIDGDALSWFRNTHRANFKFVVHRPEDLEEVDDLVKRYRLPLSSIYIQGEGVTPEEHMSSLRLVLPETLRRGWNVSSRLHILVYGNRRGV